MLRRRNNPAATRPESEFQPQHGESWFSTAIYRANPSVETAVRPTGTPPNPSLLHAEDRSNRTVGGVSAPHHPPENAPKP